MDDLAPVGTWARALVILVGMGFPLTVLFVIVLKREERFSDFLEASDASEPAERIARAIAQCPEVVSRMLTSNTIAEKVAAMAGIPSIIRLFYPGVTVPVRPINTLFEPTPFYTFDADFQQLVLLSKSSTGVIGEPEQIDKADQLAEMTRQSNRFIIRFRIGIVLFLAAISPISLQYLLGRPIASSAYLHWSMLMFMMAPLLTASRPRQARAYLVPGGLYLRGPGGPPYRLFRRETSVLVVLQDGTDTYSVSVSDGTTTRFVGSGSAVAIEILLGAWTSSLTAPRSETLEASTEDRTKGN